VYNSIGIVTYLNPFIGHHNGDIVGKICAETGKSVVKWCWSAAADRSGAGRYFLCAKPDASGL
jgi:hypothetical protein